MADKRVVLVTGASSGIGRAIALHFGVRGWRVALTARREAQLDEVAERIRAADGAAHCVAADLAADGVPKQLVESTLARFGALDVLVNNAGVGEFEPTAGITDDAYDRQFDLNVRAVVRLVRAVVPHFRRAGGGQLINIGSIVGYIGIARGPLYSATKWALRGLNESWRDELHPHNIKCAYVGPGYVISGFGGRDEAGTADEREWALVPEDVARPVYLIATQGRNSDIREIVIQVRDRS